MGRGYTKLVGIDEMRANLRQQAPLMRELAARRIGDVPPLEVNQVAERIWETMEGLRAGVGRTLLVANSKALHHILPSLVPPIDRQYTLRFFYSHMTISQGDRTAFMEMFPHSQTIAASQQTAIASRLGRGTHTSETKVIDNAIVGYVLRHLR